MKCFIDTNVLLYARDMTAPSKLSRANAWLTALSAHGAVVLSAQSLREYYWKVLRQDRSDSAVQALRRELAVLDEFVPDALRIDWTIEAWALQDRHHLSFWDSLPLAAALAGGCSLFLSEDLNSGQQIEALTIVDPFATPPEALLGAA